MLYDKISAERKLMLMKRAINKLFGGINLRSSALLPLLLSRIISLLNPPVYSTEIMGNGEEYQFDGSFTAQLSDEKFGDIEIRYNEGFED